MEVANRTPIIVDEVTISNAIQQYEDEISVDIETLESNENVRKMISNLLSVS